MNRSFSVPKIDVPAKKIMRSRWFWIAVIAALIAIGLILFFSLRKPDAHVDVPTVEVQKVQTRNVNIYGEYVGRIRAQQYVEVRARVEGYLQNMLFKEGTYVEKGQTLFIIDPRVYEAHAAKARAQLNRARAIAHKAKRDLDRIRPLYEQNAASQLDLDNAIAAYESANAEEIVCQADLTQAELTLGYTRVSSPISGYISERVADIGTLVGPSAGKSLLASIMKSDTVHIDFSMTALDYLRSKSRNVNLGGQDETGKRNSVVNITLPDGSEYPYMGKVDFTDPEVDPKTGTFSVRAEMPNPDRSLLPGEFTKVKVLLDVREDAVTIPAKAIEKDKSGAYIYVVKNNDVVERRFVETGPEVGNDVVIERGLVPGERIVVEGFHKLSQGMKVKPVVAQPEKNSNESNANTKAK